MVGYFSRWVIFMTRFYSTAQIEEKCYQYCKKHKWNIEEKMFLNIGEFRYHYEEIFTYGKDYIQHNISDITSYMEISLCWGLKDREFLETNWVIVDYLLKIGYISHEQMIDFKWVRTDFRKTVRKFCYDYFEKVSWNFDSIASFCEDNSFDFGLFEDLAQQYVRYLSVRWNSEDQYAYFCRRDTYFKNRSLTLRCDEEYVNFHYKDSSYVELFHQLRKANSVEEIVSLIGTYDIYRWLCERLHSYIIGYCGGYVTGGENEIGKELKEKLRLFSTYVTDQRTLKQHELFFEKEALQLAQIRKIFQEFMKSDFTSLSEYGESLGVSDYVVKKYLSFIQDNDPKLYQEVQNFIFAKRVQRYSCVYDMEFLYYIEHGIDQREFDLIDYYQLAGIGFDQFMLIVVSKSPISASFIPDGFSSEMVRKIRKFFEPYQKDCLLKSNDIQRIYDEKVIIGVQFDEMKKRFIPGTGREITVEEKQNILKYVELSRVPLTNGTYRVAFNRYKQDEKKFMDELLHMMKGISVEEKRNVKKL